MAQLDLTHKQESKRWLLILGFYPSFSAMLRSSWSEWSSYSYPSSSLESAHEMGHEWQHFSPWKPSGEMSQHKFMAIVNKAYELKTTQLIPRIASLTWALSGEATTGEVGAQKDPCLSDNFEHVLILQIIFPWVPLPSFFVGKQHHSFPIRRVTLQILHTRNELHEIKHRK